MRAIAGENVRKICVSGCIGGTGADVDSVGLEPPRWFAIGLAGPRVTAKSGMSVSFQAPGIEIRSAGSTLLQNVQLQLADDSLHAVRIAFRQKIFEIGKGLDRAKLPRRRDVDDDRLVIA